MPCVARVAWGGLMLTGGGVGGQGGWDGYGIDIYDIEMIYFYLWPLHCLETPFTTSSQPPPSLPSQAPAPAPTAAGTGLRHRICTRESQQRRHLRMAPPQHFRFQPSSLPPAAGGRFNFASSKVAKKAGDFMVVCSWVEIDVCVGEVE